MFRSSLVAMLLACALSLMGVGVLFAQNKGAPAPERPDLRPGDRVEVSDMGRVREAEFVQFTTVGLIKVRFDDDSQLSFPPNKVRWPKGIAPKRDPLPAGQPVGQPTGANGGGGVKRKWQDATGQFSVEAEFVGLEGDKVQLKRPDGKFLTLPLDKLSATDQEVAKALALAAAAKAPAKEPENPFEANVSDKPTVAGSPSASAPFTNKAAETKVTLQGVPTITLDAPASWTASVNPSAVPAPAIGNRTSSIPSRSGKDDFWEKADSMIVDPAHSWMWVGVKNEHGKEKSGWLERIDLAKGTVLPQILLPTIMKPLVVDPSGRYLLTSREDDFFTRGKHLDLWEIDGDGLKPSTSFKPYDKGDGNNHNIQAVSWAEFVDGTHLLTLSGNGTLVLWNLPSLKPEYLIELGGWSKTCTLSPGRKQLAIATSSGVYVLDALSGNVLGKCEMKDEGSANLHIYRVAFSDDGAQLAAVGPLNLWVWNVADGKNTTSFSGTSMPIGHEAALSFGSHKHLIIDHRYAFDIERGLMTCHYTGSWSAAVTFAGREWYLTEDGSRGAKTRSLMQFVLPGDAVVQKAKTVNEAELLAIKPGSKIALELNLPFDGAEIEKIRGSVTTAFKNNGWEVVAPGAAADFTLTTSTSQGKSEEITYRTFGRGFGNEKVTVTYQHGEMTLMAPGVEKPIWQTKTTWGPPHHIHLKEGQTLADATRTNPNPSYFMHPGIPRRLMKYPNGLSIVNADLSPKGMTVR